ncbi:PD-(D/E)XK nuclease domain-containing protein [Nocardia sp. NPDC003183]
MATRNLATRLQALINEAANLEALADKIQGADETVGLAAANTLTTEYRNWYSAALSLVPDDLRDRFRAEYEGSTWTSKIKAFLDKPRDLSPFYQPDQTVSGLNFSYWMHPTKDKFIAPFRQQVNYLSETLARIGSNPSSAVALDFLENATRKLPVTFTLLTGSHRGRAGIGVDDEYDVQHILHAILVLHFEEVEPEEPTPRMAGASSRLDFLLKQERVAIETKMIRPGLSKNKLRSELADDIVYFRAHPHVNSLFIFVYDPLRKITNPTGFENDLNSDSDDFKIRVVIAF